jgi:hypothetical protein
VTRKEAIKILLVASEGSWFHAERHVDAFVALGILRLDTIDDETFKAAAERLIGSRIPVSTASYINGCVKLESEGAYEILDVLRKSGFKITGPENG